MISALRDFLPNSGRHHNTAIRSRMVVRPMFVWAVEIETVSPEVPDIVVEGADRSEWYNVGSHTRVVWVDRHHGPY